MILFLDTVGKQLTVFDLDPDRFESFADYPDLKRAEAPEAIFSDPEIDLVFIATPNATHFELATAALRSGKAVLCEKPMAISIEDAEKMTELSEELNGFLQIGFELRYSKLYTWAKEQIEGGLIGDVVNTQCTYICSEFHGKGSWRNKRSSGGGMFGEKLSHYVDLPRWWVSSPVKDVTSFCAPNAIPYYEVRDNYSTTVRYENGAISHLTFMMAPAASLNHDPLQNHISEHSDDGHELRYLIQGMKGALETSVFSRRMRRWAFSDSPTGLRSQVVDDRRWKEDSFEDNRYVHNTTDQTLDVIRRVAMGEKPATSARDALETMRVVFAAEKSAGAGVTIAL
ncbi:MAG: Gfo/Idh/MocA family protein [Chthoniobacterales bacterium]